MEYHQVNPCMSSSLSSSWVDKIRREHVGMEVVAKITVSSNVRDPDFRVLHAQAPKT
jgi:hypothetical protein